MNVGSRRRPILVFPNAHHRGGVERMTWETLRGEAERGPVVFIGDSIDPPIAGVEHVKVAAATGSDAPRSFRSRAEQTLASIRRDGDVVVTFGVEAPAGDVAIANSVHRAWLDRGRPVRKAGIRVPSGVRRLLPRHRALLDLERSYFTAPGLRQIVVVADQVAVDLEHCYAVPASGCLTVHNGFSSAQCSPARRADHRLRQRTEWSIDDDEIALLFVGNELHRKGLLCLLQAVARAGDPRFSVRVVGRAPIDEFHGTITELGLSGRVHYHGSVDVGLAHAAADALVLPTQYEAFALTIVEALGSGLPVVTTTVPGAGDLITHDVNGYLLDDPTDATQLCGLLNRIADPDTRHRLGEAGPPTVAELEWSKIVARLDEIFQSTT